MKDARGLGEFSQQCPAEQSCSEFIREERWGGTPRCPSCGHDNACRIVGRRAFTCAGCRKRFRVRTGPVMENSRLPLKTWPRAVHMMTPARKGISCVQLATELGGPQKTAWAGLKISLADNSPPAAIKVLESPAAKRVAGWWKDTANAGADGEHGETL